MVEHHRVGAAADPPAPDGGGSPAIPHVEHVDLESAANDRGSRESTPVEATDVLEELTLPSLVQPPEPLAPDTVLGPNDHLQIAEHLGAVGTVNRYVARRTDETGEVTDVELREGPAGHVGLQREAEVLAAVQYAMLPVRHDAFEQDDRQYLSLDRLGGDTLADALRAGLDPEQAISIVVQLVQVVRRLHRAGWALVGLAPSDVCLEHPIRVTHLGHAVRIGETLPWAIQIGGYSAPELAHPAEITGKEDVYTLGAILYHALAGQPPPESGAEMAALPSTLTTPGAPQLLADALAPVEERVDAETFYRGLLALKQRLAEVSIALEVGSATSVGLNPTRPVNEDSCGYAVWSIAVAERVVQRALLCVADGMGGMDAGEVASRTAVSAAMSGAAGPLVTVEPTEEAGDRPLELTPALDPVALIRMSAPAVHAAARGRQMGTTVTCVAVHDGELTLGHVGDTRAYLLRGGVLTQLTADHSLVAAMVASGVLTKEEARGHPDSNKVLRSLGGLRELPDRYVDDLGAAFGQSSLRLEPGDWIVLCTDGVWGSVDDAQIQEVGAVASDCSTFARALIERALRAGAPDNATTVVARCVRMPSA
jgi:PPM family protein phosphatase